MDVPEANRILSQREVHSGIVKTCPELSHLSYEEFSANLIEYLQIFNVYCKRSLHLGSELSHKYALTVTCTEKDPNIMLNAIHRLLEIKCVHRIHGNIELTKQGMPHAHMTLECTKYLNKRQVVSRIKWHICLKKVKGEAGWAKYCTKDQDDKDLKLYLMSYGLASPQFIFYK